MRHRQGAEIPFQCKNIRLGRAAGREDMVMRTGQTGKIELPVLKPPQIYQLLILLQRAGHPVRLGMIKAALIEQLPGNRMHNHQPFMHMPLRGAAIWMLAGGLPHKHLMPQLRR